MENLKNSFEKESYRRGVWKINTKQLLIERLEEIKKTRKISAQVKAYVSETDQETVKLYFNNQDPDIASKSKKSVTEYVKNPGYILFSQSDSGLINIIISFPYITNLTEKSPDELLELIEPDEITEDIIDKYVDEFLDLLTIWETGIVNNCFDLNSAMELPHPEIPTY